MSQKCEVENCIGTYVRKTISYINLRKVNIPEYNISIEDYEKLDNKKGYHGVVSEKCNVCEDDLQDRLCAFIKENSKYFVSND